MTMMIAVSTVERLLERHIRAVNITKIKKRRGRPQRKMTEAKIVVKRSIKVEDEQNLNVCIA